MKLGNLAPRCGIPKRRARLIARLDIKGPNLIKGVQLEGLRVMGSPAKFAQRYYDEGIDEIIYMDCVASLYGRNQLEDVLEQAVKNIFVPLTVGGGIRSVEDAARMLRCGADKIAINTAAVKRPELISEVAERFGSQAMVLSVEAKRTSYGNWEVYTDNGREKTGRDVLDWILEGVSFGAGEILLTSVDQEGTRRGFDTELIRAVTSRVDVPVIASGGMGTPQHMLDAINYGGADAIAMADILHYGHSTIAEIRRCI